MRRTPREGRPENWTDPTSFTSETELAEPVRQWLTAEGCLRIAEEVWTDSGVADLVGATGSARSHRRRLREAPLPLDGREYDVLMFCRSERSRDELGRWDPKGFGALKARVLDSLVEGGFMSETRGRYRTKVIPRDPFSHLVAVELKLESVDQGIRQAYAYKLFADSVYLAVPMHRCSLDLEHSAREQGVGLVGVRSDGARTILKAAAGSRATARRRRLASEALLGQGGDGTRRAGSPIITAGQLLPTQ